MKFGDPQKFLQVALHILVQANTLNFLAHKDKHSDLLRRIIAGRNRKSVKSDGQLIDKHNANEAGETLMKIMLSYATKTTENNFQFIGAHSSNHLDDKTVCDLMKRFSSIYHAVEAIASGRCGWRHENGCSSFIMFKEWEDIGRVLSIMKGFLHKITSDLSFFIQKQKTFSKETFESDDNLKEFSANDESCQGWGIPYMHFDTIGPGPSLKKDLRAYVKTLGDQAMDSFQQLDDENIAHHMSQVGFHVVDANVRPHVAWRMEDADQTPHYCKVVVGLTTVKSVAGAFMEDERSAVFDAYKGELSTPP